MQIKRWLQYLWFSHRYPNLDDFVDMGLGIEARKERCQRAWEEHLTASKNFISECVQTNFGGSIPQTAIVGAGRLYDFPRDLLLANIKKFDCYDADSLARYCVMKNIPQLNYVLCELTGVMEAWSNGLSSVLEGVSGERAAHLAEKYLLNLVQPDPITLRVHYQLVVSLNLLSQIPIFWRDRVHSILETQSKIMTNDHGHYPSSLQSALVHSMSLLEKQHLDFLENTAADRIILITDKEFTYTAPGKAILRENALQIAVVEHLERYAAARTQSWDWHIAPIGIEQREFDLHHTVEAYELERKI